jgi:chromosomal replication initiation ATPase DnaA
MKKEYTFDSFYVYEGNKVAFSAAKKIVEFPGVVFNPLYIYAPDGLGKTHLLSAINLGLSKKGNSQYYTAQQFEEKLKSNVSFDAPLVVDDVNLISHTCSEMLGKVVEHALHDNIQMCFSANDLPQAVDGFTSKFCDMIRSGLICELSLPDEPARKMIIRKEADGAGIILSDEVVDNLASIQVDSVGMIENMIKRLVTYSSLGNLVVDANSIEFILRDLLPKEKTCLGPLLLKETAGSDIWALGDVDAPYVRQEYEKRIFIWENRGFDVSLLKEQLSKDTLAMRRAYHDYVEKARRLIELQDVYASIDQDRSPVDALKIELRMYNPEKAGEVEKLLEGFGAPRGSAKEYRKFNEFILGFCNKLVWDAYHDDVLENLGVHNPFVILGNSGTGKTHFLEAVCDDLISRSKSVMFLDLTNREGSVSIADTADTDILVLDNLDAILDASESMINDVGELIDAFRNAGKQVIIASAPAAEGVNLPASLKGVFDEARVVELEKPSADVINEYIKRNMSSEAYEMFDQDLPEFESFYEIDYFLSGLNEDEAAIVPLGLPGEDESAEGMTVSEGEAPVGETARVSDTERSSAKGEGDYYMLPEVRSELIAEKF